MSDVTFSLPARRAIATEPTATEPATKPTDKRASLLADPPADERGPVDPRAQRDGRSRALRADCQMSVQIHAMLPPGAPAPLPGAPATSAGASLLDRVIANTPRNAKLLDAVIAQTYREGMTRVATEAAARSLAGRIATWLGRAGGPAAFLAVLFDSKPLNGGESEIVARMHARNFDAQRLSDLGLRGDAVDRFQHTRTAIQDAAASVRADPSGQNLDAQLRAIQGENPALVIERGETANAGSLQMTQMRERAAELQREGRTPEEAMREAAGELHSRIASESDRERGRPVRYSFDREAGRAFVPGDFTIAGRAPNLNDPAERALVDAHNRAVLEEVTHAAGFSARPGEYTPLSPRTAMFDAFMRSNEGRAWARQQGFTDEQIARFTTKMHEADVVDVLREHNPMSRAEIDRYPERQAFVRFIEQLDRELATRGRQR